MSKLPEVQVDINRKRIKFKSLTNPKPMFRLTVLTLISIFVFGACTMEKRLYRNGYNVQWHASLKTNKTIGNGDLLVTNQAEQKIPNQNLNLLNEVDNERITLVVEDCTAEIKTIEAQRDKVSKSSVSNSKKGPVFEYFVPQHKSMASVQQHSLTKHKDLRLNRALKKLSVQDSSSDDIPLVLLFILCFIFPPIAVGLATNWDIETVIYNIIWCVLCGVPGIIHALIVVGRNS